jgi:hypothetical protein
MATYLTWNPIRWHWKNFADDREKVRRGTAGQHRWSCGNSRFIEPGSRFFLIRLGNQPKGIIALGKSFHLLTRISIGIARGGHEARAAGLYELNSKY